MRFVETPQECKDRAYWDKRFNFASWLFLVFGFYLIFFTENANSGLFALCVSWGYRVINMILQARHMKWHMKQDNE